MTTTKITSLQNAGIKDVVKLRDRKARRETGRTIVEGLLEIRRAKEGECVLAECYVCEDFLDDRDKGAVEELCSGVKTFRTTKEVFEKISYGERHEGVLAVVEPKPVDSKDIQLPENPLVVVLEEVEKPGNLGAVLRSCDGAGVDCLIVCEGLTDLYNPNTIRASLGTVFTIPVLSLDREQTVAFLEEKGIKICATVPHASVLYSKVDLTGPVAFVLGNEHKGLTSFWNDNSDVQVRIPMNGAADSLNVSVSAAIMIYEALRQRDG